MPIPVTVAMGEDDLRGTRLDHGHRVADRAHRIRQLGVHDLAAVRAPDIGRNILLVAEAAGGGFESRQRGSLGDDIMWGELSGPPGWSESPSQMGPLEPLGQRTTPLPEVLRLRDGVRSRS